MNTQNNIFSTMYIPFQKEYLQELLVIFKRTATTEKQNEFLEIWSSYIVSMKKELRFISQTSQPESFSTPLILNRSQVFLTFNADRVNRYIATNRIKTLILNSEDLSDKVDISNEYKPLDVYKKENPVIIYFPIHPDKEYLCIDGNHRVHNHKHEGVNFKYTFISPDEMKPEFFHDLYSFIAYEIIALYSIMTNSNQEEQRILDESIKIIDTLKNDYPQIHYN